MLLYFLVAFGQFSDVLLFLTEYEKNSFGYSFFWGPVDYFARFPAIFGRFPFLFLDDFPFWQFWTISLFDDFP